MYFFRENALTENTFLRQPEQHRAQLRVQEGRSLRRDDKKSSKMSKMSTRPVSNLRNVTRGNPHRRTKAEAFPENAPGKVFYAKNLTIF